MTQRAMNPKVDDVVQQEKKWRMEFEKLRAIALECPLSEELRWGCPCYTYEGSNVVLIHGFKAYCALLFFKGALLKDPHGILIQQTANVQAARQIRFTALSEIAQMRSTAKAYIEAAIEVEKSRQKVEFKKTTEFKIPEELKTKFTNDPALEKAFAALTPGRQRAYLLHFSAAKQAATRAARIEKCAPQISQGRGWNER